VLSGFDDLVNDQPLVPEDDDPLVDPREMHRAARRHVLFSAGLLQIQPINQGRWKCKKAIEPCVQKGDEVALLGL
jgi:hypothetical protein